jgi:hypothetical protein
MAADAQKLQQIDKPMLMATMAEVLQRQNNTDLLRKEPSINETDNSNFVEELASEDGSNSSPIPPAKSPAKVPDEKPASSPLSKPIKHEYVPELQNYDDLANSPPILLTNHIKEE